MKENLFVVIEGIDGSGKSTLMRELEKHLKNTVFTREPRFFSKEGKIIEKGWKKLGHILTEKQLINLMVKSREEHNEHLIKPSLKDKKDVICDRYIWSTYAYQGNENTYQKIINENYNNEKVSTPHLIVYLSVPIEEALRRTKERVKEGSEVHTNFDEKMEKKFNVVQKNYLEIMDKHKELSRERKTEILVLDSTKDLEKNVQKVIEKIKELKNTL